MADSKPIKYSQIAEPNLLEPLIKELQEVNRLLGTTETSLKAVVTEAAKVAKQTPLDSFANIEKVEKSIGDTTKAVEELDKVEKDRIKLQQRLKELEDDRIQANFDIKEQIRLQSKELRDNAKATAASGDAYKKLTKDTNEAQAEFKRLAAEFGANSKQAEEARKTFDKFDEQLREVNEAARDGRRDVGRYEKGAAQLNRTFKAFASATIVLKIFELLGTSFNQNSDGAASLEKQVAKLSATFQVIAERLAIAFPIILAKLQEFTTGAQLSFAKLTGFFGDNKAEVQRLQKEYDALATEAGKDLTDVFTGMGGEIADLIVKKTELIDSTLEYRREIIDLENEVSGLITTQQQLRDTFEDDSRSLNEQIEAGVAYRENLQQTQSLEAEIAAKRLSLAQQNAAANSVSVEAQEELSAATREYNSLIADQASELASTEREIQKLRDDATQLNLDFYVDDAQNRIDVNARIIADETQTFERRRELLKQNQEEAETANDLRAAALNKSLAERGKAELDFEELRKKTSSEEIARAIQESGISEQLSVRALEIIRERRTELQDNEEAQRDLNDAEAESLLLQSDIALQQEAINKLDEKGVDINKVLVELSKERLQNEIDNLRAQLLSAEDGSARFLQINQELNDKLLEQDEQRNSERLEKLGRFNEEAQAGFEALGDLVAKRSENQINSIDKELEAEENRVNRLQELAAQGDEDAQENIVNAQQRQAELELERERQLQKQKQSELVLTAIQTYGAKVTSGDESPLASTISDIAVLRAFVSSLPAFFDGTEDTGTVARPLDSNGGRLAVLHDNERVLSSQQNKLVGKMSNSELAMLAHREKSRSAQPDNSQHIIKELRELKQITKEKEVYLGTDYDKATETAISHMRKGNKLERKHRKTGGIWGR